ncbi:UNVERIFIED_ORG: GR25 family glycosyltransferase involved in LPS biosynthesis [Methylobacterium sp. SuP10 SLI 274]|nr:GR25 family glycosyltransferase involved in LPS biosynthesis [Methylorubrum extorquens]MDF9864149.1 GR25 family glycosyltransferase involved in LPS biosynthesis [Methylorubrum pseudosasae]MDH6637742.1 GR25 family glycosyltransferase involved in LPS biosynthesis [Methylobacterium sp. SuP10 SLI 274]MDH6666921.1 GR25 family glycosyltransferase involved in LPS biosynthesis [Methylorubrum zatmanii]
MRSLPDTTGRFRRHAFRALRAVASVLPGGRISAFGAGKERIGLVLVVNLDRQPCRLRRTMRELGRFRTFDGASLASLARRFAAVDARDGRAVAATADVDPTYLLSHQLHVQPSARLEECFGADEPIRMTRQEVAVARSHIEVWKAVASGPHDHVLILEDDVWFRPGAAAAVDRGWRAAWERHRADGGPHLLYLSYADAGKSAERADRCDALFRPLRGLWFLSGYVLSREGAEMLLRAMPVVGPVDMWMNFQFDTLGALALASPAILQRMDGGSDNAHSILPYLARAGIVDAHLAPVPPRARSNPVLAWTACGEREGLAMALSMLGLRVRAFDGNEPVIHAAELPDLLDAFDALVDAPLATCALSDAIGRSDVRFVLEGHAPARHGVAADRLPPGSTAILPPLGSDAGRWRPICDLLGVEPPPHIFPVGPPRCWRLFRDDRKANGLPVSAPPRGAPPADESPWAMLPGSDWPPSAPPERSGPARGERLVHAPMTAATPQFPGRVETFPGNLATFERDGLVHGADGARLVLDAAADGNRPFRSGAFASPRPHGHGRFEAEIKAARGPGLVTGFFLHRAFPRQEIDIEITGDDTRRMLTNVYFNPGDDGTAMDYGYRGSPCRIDLGFDAAADFHHFAIDWRPGHITWLVDGRNVHQRVSWDPTPIPHLPMRLHGNLWAPRSSDLAGRIDEGLLPATAIFRNVSIWT